MMTKYAEIALSMKYRYRNAAGEWMGGPMVFLERGLGRRWLAVLFSIFCLLASFGIGNMSQANSVSSALSSGFGVPAWATGAAISSFCAASLCSAGSPHRRGCGEDRAVLAVFARHILGGLTIVAVNYRGTCLLSGISSPARWPAGGGRRRVVIPSLPPCATALPAAFFPTKPGLGSSAHRPLRDEYSAEPVRQAVWGVFEVFVDTIVVCTITALCLLVTGVVGAPDGEGGLTGAALTIDVLFAWIGRICRRVCR